ncbi:hypothetical protein ACWG0P_13995 [Amedibacillus sp. YH-ame6]
MKDILHDYYKGVLEKALRNEVVINLEEGCEGSHDCLDIIIKDYQSLQYNGIEYYPHFIMFYGYVERLGGCLESDKKTGYYDECYSLTNEAFGDGLHIDCGSNSNLWEMILEVIKANTDQSLLVRGEKRNESKS